MVDTIDTPVAASGVAARDRRIADPKPRGREGLKMTLPGPSARSSRQTVPKINSGDAVRKNVERDR